MPEEKRSEEKSERSESKDKKILELAKKEYKLSVDAFSENFREAIAMLKFKHGIDQWSSEEQRDRKDSDRPCMTINELPKYSQQICGEMRLNKVQIKVCPAGQDSTQEDAKIISGLITRYQNIILF